MPRNGAGRLSARKLTYQNAAFYFYFYYYYSYQQTLDGEIPCPWNLITQMRFWISAIRAARSYANDVLVHRVSFEIPQRSHE